MPTVRLIYDVDGWAYHGNARGLEAYAPPDFAVSSTPSRIGDRHLDWDVVLGDRPVDLVFVFNFYSAPAVRAALTRRGWDSRLMVAWSVGWPRQRPYFFQAYCVADAMLVANHEWWDRSGRLPGTFAIPYGVDGAIFRTRAPIAPRRPRVLWVGSEKARTIKGYDEFILPLQATLRARGIDCECLLVDSFGTEKRTAQEMAEWYNSGTVIVCASEAEGTPNPPLEAAACGCTIVSTPVGNMPELIRHDVNGYLVPRTAEALLEGVLAAVANHERLAAQMQADIVPWLWAHRSEQFYAVFREVLDCRPAAPGVRPRRRPDLSSRVTVFVTTVGDPTLAECLDHLGRQDAGFWLEVIEDVMPLSAALQRALDQCQTPYLVQVDEDMLLFPAAIRTLVEALEAQPPEVVTYVGALYDVHLDRGIQGVKISRHDLARRYPWSETPWVLERNARIIADGYRIEAAPVDRLTKSSPSVLGLHGTRWTPASIYGRYFVLETWRRARPETMGWFGKVPAMLLERFLAQPDASNYLALMGVIAAALRCGKGPLLERDGRTDGNLPGFAALEQLFAELAAAPVDEPR